MGFWIIWGIGIVLFLLMVGPYMTAVEKQDEQRRARRRELLQPSMTSTSLIVLKQMFVDGKITQRQYEFGVEERMLADDVELQEVRAERLSTERDARGHGASLSRDVPVDRPVNPFTQTGRKQ